MFKLTKNNFLSIIITITLITSILMITFIYKSSDTIIESKKYMLLNEAKALFTNMIFTRFWNASHNGVFVKKQDGIEPNPYLTNNSMKNDKGETYIKINPAWMTRQISEITNKKSNYYFKITSLKPLNPDNKPDLFESEGLNYFEKNKGKKYFYRFSNNLEKFDFIGRLNTEKSCLQCHAKQNYKVGDTRGGIRVTIPTQHVANSVKTIKNQRFYFSLFIVFISFVILIIFSYLINKIFFQHTELININKNLESKIKKEVEKNIQKEQKLTQQSKLVAMGEMIGNIAHQWRQPLSVISTGATGLKLQHEMGILKEKDLKHMLDAINENAQYLSQTIDDFKNFIKGDKEACNYNLENCSNSFIKIIESNMKKYQIKIVSNTDNLELYGYPNQLIQCFINLFNNSKDAFLENNIPEEDRYIFITNYISNKNVIIEFKDSANGIPTTVIDKIFTPYFTTKEDEKGTGLGLYMTQDLIKKGMGGTIEISNESYIYNNKELKGAKFKITIPINIEL